MRSRMIPYKYYTYMTSYRYLKTNIVLSIRKTFYLKVQKTLISGRIANIKQNLSFAYYYIKLLKLISSYNIICELMKIKKITIN